MHLRRWLLLLAVVPLAVAAAMFDPGERRAGRGLVRAGTGLLWTGAALLLLGVGVDALSAGDRPLWWLHDSDSLGRLVPVTGSLLLGLGALRSDGTAPWPGIALVLAGLVAVPFNVQDERVLLDVPLGVAWLLLGSLEVVRRRPSAGRRRT